MNNLEMAKSHINQAIERIKHAREAINGGNYHTWLGSVRRLSSYYLRRR